MISEHDLVFMSPIDDPTFGMPIGDGSTGCLIWPEGDRLVFAINHTDLWDLRESEEQIHNWSRDEEEQSTSLRHAGRLELRFDAPVFDLLYQKDYEARLSLEDACLNLRSLTPFSEVSVRAFGSHENLVTVVECEAAFSDSAAPEVLLERWGSRTFAHWYSLVRRDPEIGLSGTETAAEENAIYITQKLKGRTFCLAATLESALPCSAKRLHGRAGKFSFESANACSFRVYLTVADADSEESALALAKGRLCAALQAGAEVLYKSHAAAWGEIWGRAFVQIPDDYVENLWYLAIYYANCEMRGKYPPHFCNGIWGFLRDFVPWNYYFHYNTQLGYWPLLAAGQPELLMPYLNFRYRQLPYAVQIAKNTKGVDGALYTDVASATGACDLGTTDNLTPGSQIAQTFWKYYAHTGDREFLADKAWPIIRETALLYAGLVKRGEDGLYHIYATEAYEGTPKMDDSITDHSAMRMIFAIAMACMDEMGIEDGNRAKWGEILANLAPIGLIEPERDEYYEKDGQKYIANGLGKDKPMKKCLVPVTGIYRGEARNCDLEDGDYWHNLPAGTPLRTTFNSVYRKPYYGFPGAEFALVMPSGVVGLKDRGSDLFEAVVNIARLEKLNRVDGDQVGLSDNDEVFNMGWCINMIVLARLGLSEELLATLNNTIQTWQWYPNGFGHYGGYREALAESNLRFNRRMVSDADAEGKFMFPAWPFRHFDFEMLPIIATAVNEMLLQSHEGRIRLFAACPADYSGEFRLSAEGGFVVHSQMESGKVLFAEIEAARDGVIRLVDPWGQKRIYAARTTAGGIEPGRYVETSPDLADDVAELKILAGERLIVAKTEHEIINRQGMAGSKPQNASAKQCGRAWLGVPRMF